MSQNAIWHLFKSCETFIGVIRAITEMPLYGKQRLNNPVSSLIAALVPKIRLVSSLATGRIVASNPHSMILSPQWFCARLRK
jgi:hypothetical protein